MLKANLILMMNKTTKIICILKKYFNMTILVHRIRDFHLYEA